MSEKNIDIIKCPRCGVSDFEIRIETEQVSTDRYSVHNAKLTFCGNQIRHKSLKNEVKLVCNECLQVHEDKDPVWYPSDDEIKIINRMILKRQIVDVSEFVKQDISTPKKPHRPEPELIEESFF